MKIGNVFFAIIIFFAMIFVSGCSGDVNVASKEAEGKIKVYTSFYTMYDFASKIGGDKIVLNNLIPAGVEPHDWEPAPRDIVNLEKADVFIYNGAGMEGWAEKIINSVNNKNLIVVEASKDTKLLRNTDQHEEDNHEDMNHEEAENHEEHDHEEHNGDTSNGEDHQGHDHSHLEYDPHVWLDPQMAKIQMEAIKKALVLADPSNGQYYQKNFEEVAKEIDKLDSEFKEALLKYKSRNMIVAHKAFGYLAHAYNLKQIEIEGLNAESEPSPARMAEIIDFAKENNIKVIFFEELISPKVANTIAKEVGASSEVLNPLEGLKQEDINNGREYFSVMRDNLKALKKAFELSNN